MTNRADLIDRTDLTDRTDLIDQTDLIGRTNSDSPAVPTKTNYPRVTILAPIINILMAGYEACLILKNTTLRNMFRFKTLLPLAAVSLNSYYYCKKTNTLPAGNQEEYENQIKSAAVSAMSAFMRITPFVTNIEEIQRGSAIPLSIPTQMLMQLGGKAVGGTIASLYDIKKKSIVRDIWIASTSINKLIYIYYAKSRIDEYSSFIRYALTSSRSITSILTTLTSILTTLWNISTIVSDIHATTEASKELMNDLSNLIIVKKLWNYAKPFYEKYKIIRYGLAGIAAVFVGFPKIYIGAKIAWTATIFLRRLFCYLLPNHHP